MGPGEKRRRQAKRARQHEAYELAMKPLREAEASCSKCKHFERLPYSSSKWSHHCSIDQDRDGYTVRKPTDLCPAFLAPQKDIQP